MIYSKVISGYGTSVELIEYTFYSEILYQGPDRLARRKEFKVHAFSNPNFCGLRFRRFVDYLLYLDDPSRNSVAGLTGPNTFYVDQCSQTYVFKGMSSSQKNFLRNNRKK